MSYLGNLLRNLKDSGKSALPCKNVATHWKAGPDC
jgi:hypothetical protein